MSGWEDVARELLGDNEPSEWDQVAQELLGQASSPASPKQNEPWEDIPPDPNYDPDAAALFHSDSEASDHEAPHPASHPASHPDEVSDHAAISHPEASDHAVSHPEASHPASHALAIPRPPRRALSAMGKQLRHHIQDFEASLTEARADLLDDAALMVSGGVGAARDVAVDAKIGESVAATLRSKRASMEAEHRLAGILQEASGFASAAQGVARYDPKDEAIARDVLRMDSSDKYRVRSLAVVAEQHGVDYKRVSRIGNMAACSGNLLIRYDAYRIIKGLTEEIKAGWEESNRLKPNIHRRDGGASPERFRAQTCFSSFPQSPRYFLEVHMGFLFN